MFDPQSPANGRALLIFAAFVIGFGAYLGLARSSWNDGLLWLALGVFLASYGAITLDLLPRQHRPLLVLGLSAGLVALLQALRLALGG